MITTIGLGIGIIVGIATFLSGAYWSPSFGPNGSSDWKLSAQERSARFRHEYGLGIRKHEVAVPDTRPADRVEPLKRLSLAELRVMDRAYRSRDAINGLPYHQDIRIARKERLLARRDDLRETRRLRVDVRELVGNLDVATLPREDLERIIKTLRQ